MRCEEMLNELAAMDLHRESGEPFRLMEICGTHTMAIAKAGLRQLLPDGIRLISGPGCPVCVTPAELLDTVLELSEVPGITITSYGDLLRVPGSHRGDNLSARKAKGADIRVVYSPMDALEIAKKEPKRQVVFLGVGFETTAPGTGISILQAEEQGVKNYSVFSMLKYTEPAIRAILKDPQSRIDGLICPGHVASIMGAESFRFLPQEYGLPAVTAGFEQEDVVTAVYRLCRMLAEERPDLKNEYTRAVRADGNPTAKQVLKQVFEPEDSIWRGLGEIPGSGMQIREAYREMDAKERFADMIAALPAPGHGNTGCRCGDVLRGNLSPEECPLFGKACMPSDPAGPCMVSGEGACAAAYKYRML